MKSFFVGLLLSAALATGACSKRAADDQAGDNVTATNLSTAAATASEAPPASINQADASVPATKFDMASVPLSSTKLGTFPYLSLPDGYEAAGGNTLGVAKVPYWVGDHFEWIEGRAFQSTVGAKTGTDFSGYEVKRNIEALIQQAGGKQVFEGKVSGDAVEKLPEDVRQTLNTGLGGVYSEVVDVYVIHQADKDVWVQYSSNTAEGRWLITETKAFVPTAKLLPATALKTSLDTSGKATIHINFAFDEAVLPSSALPQIGEVAKLMADPSLRLSIDGHTDNSGEAKHNLTLSQARARSVVVALVAQHVSSDRLLTKGFGSERPVATNDTEEGRAQNRRVELVRV